MSGLQKKPKPRKEKKALPHGWIVVPSKSYPDRVYFYNTLTKCSTWSNPCKDECNGSSSSTSCLGGKKLLKNINKATKTLQSNKQRSKTILYSPERSCNVRINHEIEDYDEQQDQYIDNICYKALSLSDSNIIRPSSSPDSVLSSKTSISDSGKQLESNVFLEDNKKQLWVHFMSSPDKSGAKKSVAVSDFEKSSTIRNFKLELTQETGKKKSLLKSLSKDIYQSHVEDESPKGTSYQCVNSLKSKKKTKKKQKESNESVKNLLFKKRDKTPAQTRLLKLRRENAEKLKELAPENSQIAITKSIGRSARSKNSSGFFDLEGQREDDNFNDAYLKIELCNSVAQENEIQSKADCSEEMDWEPSNVESDVRNINVFRQQAERSSEISSSVFSGIDLDHSFILSSEKQSWFLVLDTNIFVSCLAFVKELRDTKVPDLGYPIIYVPWRVLQELDHLKETKIDGVDKNLHINVRKAIAYLNDNFKSRHPRVFGQSFEDFANMIDVQVSAPDDEILQTCVQFQKKHKNNKLMLLTNDKNLESKAIISGVEVYSKEMFQKKYLNFTCASSSYSNATNASSDKEIKIDNSFCEIKAILKDLISLIVETEMRIAFDEDWVKLAYKKPPWSLQDALDCLLKHWRSVFFINFSNEAHSEAERLYDKLFKKAAVKTKDIVEIIKTTEQLLLSIRRSQKLKRPYIELIPTSMTKLFNLLQTLTSTQSQAEDTTTNSLLSSFPTVNEFFSHNQKVFQDIVLSSGVSKVKNLFKDIWDSIRSFCCSISDVILSSGTMNENTLQELRMKLAQTLNEVKEFVVTVENILEINPADISDLHPLIVNFSNFLIHVYPAMALETKNELPKSLAAFFTDFEGRSLLSSSLKDFKQFIQDLSNAVEYFNTLTFNAHFC